ncbi:hypothetical protein ACQ4WY_25755 [Janthinobacterium sp. LB2P49]|uniref:hypothetical protein n=1 Tax=Janthinobacterium sp. LB2P49 TaxID=3424198 RepID=UPI003F249A4C
MKTAKQMFFCGLAGAIIGILLSRGEPLLLAVAVSIMGIFTLLFLYGIIFLAVFVNDKIPKDGQVNLSQKVINMDDYEYGGTKYFSNPAYRIDENGDPTSDPQWLIREPQ